MKTCKVLSIDYHGFKYEVIEHFDVKYGNANLWVYQKYWDNGSYKRKLVTKYVTIGEALFIISNKCIEHINNGGW